MIDWSRLAEDLGAEDPLSSGGKRAARQALLEIVGAEGFAEAVEHCIELRAGFGLARAVLDLVRPLPALRRCFEIYRRDGSLDRRRRAVELLRDLADERSIGWAIEFLRDDDEAIQWAGASLVERVLWGFGVEADEVEMELAAMGEHRNPAVRERHAAILGFLAARGFE